jgi:hypothetical protein
MLEKLKKCWADFRLAIVAGALALVYFLGRKRREENEKVLENLARANKARASLRNPDTTRKLHDKYKR